MGRPGGMRRHRFASVWVPKKNGKSGLCSLLTLYLLVADGEARAEVYAAATDRQQAGIVFNESALMVRKSPHLSRKCNVIDSTKTIVFKDSRYQAMSGEHAGSEGKNAHAIVSTNSTPGTRRTFASCLLRCTTHRPFASSPSRL